MNDFRRWGLLPPSSAIGLGPVDPAAAPFWIRRPAGVSRTAADHPDRRQKMLCLAGNVGRALRFPDRIGPQIERRHGTYKLGDRPSLR